MTKSNVRCFRVSHFDGSKKTIYEGAYTSDIHARCQKYADASGFLVRLVCNQPHELKSFQPHALRENPDAPPIVDPDAPPQTPLEQLGWSCLREDGGMFLDDRMPMTRRNRRMNDKKVVAWLNHSRSDGFSLNIRLPNVFGLDKPIPRRITDAAGAVEWVYRHAYWKADHTNE